MPPEIPSHYDTVIYGVSLIELKPIIKSGDIIWDYQSMTFEFCRYDDTHDREEILMSGEFDVNSGASFVLNPDDITASEELKHYEIRIVAEKFPLRELSFGFIGLRGLTVEVNGDDYFYTSRQNIWHALVDMPETLLYGLRPDGIVEHYDQNSFVIQFFASRDDTVPLEEYPFDPFNGQTFILDETHSVIKIIGEMYPMAYLTVYSHDNVIDRWQVAFDGDFVTGGLFPEDGALLRPYEASLVHLYSFKINAPYRDDKLRAFIYRVDESTSWTAVDFDPNGGLSFPAGEDYGRIVIYGYTSPDPPEPPGPEKRITIYIKKDPTIQSAILFTGNTMRYLDSERRSFQVLSGTRVEFDSINIAEGYDIPYILRFYKTSEYRPEDVKLTTKFISGFVLPSYSANDETLYAEISATIPEFLWYEVNEEVDRYYIKNGNLFTENFSADMWNRFRSKLREILAMYGINYSYAQVSSNDIFIGIGDAGTIRSDFSDVLDNILLLPGSSMTIGHKGTGATVFASYFQNSPETDWRHGNSIKKALNDIIKRRNGEYMGI